MILSFNSPSMNSLEDGEEQIKPTIEDKALSKLLYWGLCPAGEVHIPLDRIAFKKEFSHFMDELKEKGQGKIESGCLLTTLCYVHLLLSEEEIVELILYGQKIPLLELFGYSGWMYIFQALDYMWVLFPRSFEVAKALQEHNTYYTACWLAANPDKKYFVSMGKLKPEAKSLDDWKQEMADNWQAIIDGKLVEEKEDGRTTGLTEIVARAGKIGELNKKENWKLYRGLLIESKSGENEFWQFRFFEMKKFSWDIVLKKTCHGRVKERICFFTRDHCREISRVYED
jgi:hypothetical protein